MLLSLQTLVLLCHFPFERKIIFTQSISLPPELSAWYKFRSLSLYNLQPDALALEAQGTYNIAIRENKFWQVALHDSINSESVLREVPSHDFVGYFAYLRLHCLWEFIPGLRDALTENSITIQLNIRDSFFDVAMKNKVPFRGDIWTYRTYGHIGPSWLTEDVCWVRATAGKPHGYCKVPYPQPCFGSTLERGEWIMLVRLCSFLLSSCVSFP